MNRLEEISNKFGVTTVKRAQLNLNLSGFAGQKSNRKKNSSKKLSRGLGYELQKTKTGLIIEFTSKEDYGKFVEEGRRKGKMPPISALIRYIRIKPIKLRKDGRFVQKTDSSIRSAAFAMAKSIKEKGIKPTPFFGEALDSTFNKMQPEFEEAIALDLEDIIFNNFQKNGSNS